MDELTPSEMTEALSQVPLFRELQRLLVAQQGPVNWEIARQIANAVAQAGGPGRRPGEGERQRWEEAVRLAELKLGEAMSLDVIAPVGDIELMERPAWAAAGLEAFRPLVERLAGRLQGQIQSQGSPALGVQTFLDTLGPFLLGVEVGFLVGHLSRQVLGQFDLCYPMHPAGKLLFAYPNLAGMAPELEVDEEQFRMWLALHEVAHHLEFTAMGWPRAHLAGLAEAYVDAADFDSEELITRLRGLGDPERLMRLMERPDELLPLLVTPAQQQVAARIQVFMSVLEGYADWAVDQAGAAMLSQLPRMKEAMGRRRAERSSLERLLEGLLGLDLKLESYRSGQRFIRVVEGAGQLARLWEGPGSLPSPDELADPNAWLKRVAFS